MYRILNKGEIIEYGDEIDSSSGWNDGARWVPVPSHCIGQSAPDPSYPAHSIFHRLTLRPADVLARGESAEQSSEAPARG